MGPYSGLWATFSKLPDSDQTFSYSILYFEYNQTLQHILTRCDGEHSRALTTQIIFVPHKFFGVFLQSA